LWVGGGCGVPTLYTLLTFCRAFAFAGDLLRFLLVTYCKPTQYKLFSCNTLKINILRIFTLFSCFSVSEKTLFITIKYYFKVLKMNILLLTILC